MKIAKREEIMEKFGDNENQDDAEMFSDYEGFTDTGTVTVTNKLKEEKTIQENDESISNEVSENNEDSTDDAGESVTEPYLDVGRSFLEAYKNLSPKQIEGLTFDTKELLTTQQKLIETLNTIGPTLKEGKNILDTFKDYFVEDNKK